MAASQRREHRNKAFGCICIVLLLLLLYYLHIFMRDQLLLCDLCNRQNKVLKSKGCLKTAHLWLTKSDQVKQKYKNAIVKFENSKSAWQVRLNEWLLTEYLRLHLPSDCIKHFRQFTETSLRQL